MEKDTLGALRAFGAFGALRALGALRAFGTLGAFGAFGALGTKVPEKAVDDLHGFQRLAINSLESDLAQVALI